MSFKLGRGRVGGEREIAAIRLSKPSMVERPFEFDGHWDELARWQTRRDGELVLLHDVEGGGHGKEERKNSFTS